MPIELNALESTRFGITAARVVDLAASPEQIEAAARDLKVNLLIHRLDVVDLGRVQAFEEAGYRLMDTLLYFKRALADHLADPVLPEGVTLRLATPADAAEVAALAKVGFAGYIGHYHADPRLDPAAADAAYVQWAERCALSTTKDDPVLIAEANGSIAGFLACRSGPDESLELLLSSVSPNYAKYGIYTLLIHSSLLMARDSGCKSAFTSTQINNYKVQKVWSKQGFFHFKSVYTFHRWL